MAEITAAAVKALRAKTDLPMMKCKKALQEANGDEEQAIALLRQQVGKLLVDRGANTTAEGRVFIAMQDDHREVAMVEMQCESAPVAGGEHFNDMGIALANQLLTGPGAETVDQLLEQKNADGQTFKDAFEELINKIREKIVVSRIARLEGPFGEYIHHDGKTAVIFQAEGEPQDRAVLRDVAMHIAAMKPDVANVSDLDPSVVEEERKRLTEEAKATGKPDNIIDKIVDGRMNAFYKDSAGVLVEQPFAKDDSKSVSQVLAEAGVKAKAFHLWVIGG